MTEVTSDNFSDILPLVLENIRDSDFVAIDCEFTGLSADPSLDPNLFDTPDARYKKLRSSARKLTICQFGICTFTKTLTKDPVLRSEGKLQNRYEGKCFTFFLCPRSVSDARSKKMMLNSSSIEFLNDHHFNFDKWLRTGIPFMNKEEEEYLRLVMRDGDIVSEICDERDDRLDQMFSLIDQIKAFASGGATGKPDAGDSESKEPVTQILVPFVSSVNEFRNFAMVSRLRRIFPDFWIRLTNGHLLVKRLTDGDEGQEEREARDLSYTEDEEQAVEYMRGFSRVIQVLIESQKVIVGHNSLTDLVFLYQQLIADLPPKLPAFKQAIKQSFPTIYDTKHMIMNMRKTVPELDFVRGTSLTELYEQLGVPEYVTSFTFNPVVELMSDENAVGEFSVH